MPVRFGPLRQVHRMEEIWIIGLGRFGSSAFQRLSHVGQDRHFVLVDLSAENLLQLKGPNTTLRISEGVDYLNTHLSHQRMPDWIIPALPVHLAAEWMLARLGAQRLKRVFLPSAIEAFIPNPMRGSEGNLYTSHANFKCPDDCEEPRGICTVTRKARKQDMFELLGNLDIEPFTALSIRSRQLGPGIGGYRPEQLMASMAKVEKTRGPILLSTACRCHGVITGLEHL